MKIREYLATIYFNNDQLVDKFISEIRSTANDKGKVK